MKDAAANEPQGMSAAKAIRPGTSQHAFQDVNRACHRWLMKNDPTYREAREAYEAGDKAKAARLYTASSDNL